MTEKTDEVEALRALYAYYRGTERMGVVSYRDVELVPANWHLLVPCHHLLIEITSIVGVDCALGEIGDQLPEALRKVSDRQNSSKSS